MFLKAFGVAIGASLALGACSNLSIPSQTDAQANLSEPCENTEKIGRFDPAKDLFLAQFDIKTDTDDLHSAAAVATMLAHPQFACVDYVAVSGTYGTQGGTYVDPESLFANAFGERWIDAHDRKEAAAEALAARAAPVLRNGGDVWIMEGGQSDVSAETLRQILAKSDDPDLAERFHVVQHSDWNERVTTPDDLAFLKATADYIKIPDGNAVGNGTPGFRTPDGAAWTDLLAAPKTGALWAQAKEIALRRNGSGYDDESIAAGGYDNQAIGAGGLDFSDTSEMAYIFGYETLADVDAFVDAFVK